MGVIEDVIINAVKESLDNGVIEETIREKVQDAIKESINDVFRWGSEGRKALDEKVSEILVPAIQRRDLSAFLPKLDTVLTEICNQTALMDNKTILENFRELMIEPEEKTIKVSDLFKAYKDFVADNISTYGREVNTDDQPTYESVNVKVEVEKDENRRYSWRESLVLHFSIVDEDGSDEENLNRDIDIWRYKESRIEGYELVYGKAPEVKGLLCMDKFEVLLLRLARADVRILVDTDYDEDYVIPTDIPEATYG